MSNSYIQYKNHGFWFRSDAVRDWFLAMSKTIEDQPQKPDWLNQLGQSWWHDIATEPPGRFNVLIDDFIKTQEHADAILSIARRTLPNVEFCLPDISQAQKDGLPWTTKFGEWFILLITQPNHWDPQSDDASIVCINMPFATKQAYRSLLLKALTHMIPPGDFRQVPDINPQEIAGQLSLLEQLARANLNNFWDFHDGVFWDCQARYAHAHPDWQLVSYRRWFDAFLASPEPTIGPASKLDWSQWPREPMQPQPLSSTAKRAYRILLQDALAVIHQTTSAPTTWRTWFWPRGSTQIRMAGDLAQWVQTLAQASANDFTGFDEEEFWRPYSQMSLYFPAIRAFRINFERSF
jgi:hypothetical protein